jgi:hypothetical protein
MLHTYIGKNLCARLGEDLTHGQVRLDLSEPVGSHICRTLARFCST